MKREVATPVGPAYSMPMKPASGHHTQEIPNRDRAAYSIGPGVEAVGHLFRNGAARSKEIAERASMSIQACVQVIDLGLLHAFRRKAIVKVISVATVHAGIDFVAIDVSLTDALWIVLKSRSVRTAGTAADQWRHCEQKSNQTDFHFFNSISHSPVSP